VVLLRVFRIMVVGVEPARAGKAPQNLSTEEVNSLVAAPGCNLSNPSLILELTAVSQSLALALQSFECARPVRDQANREDW